MSVEVNKGKLFDVIVDGYKVNPDYLPEIHQYYEACCSAEYFIDKYNLPTKEAIGHGYAVRRLMDECGYTESEALEYVEDHLDLEEEEIYDEERVAKLILESYDTYKEALEPDLSIEVYNLNEDEMVIQLEVTENLKKNLGFYDFPHEFKDGITDECYLEAYAVLHSPKEVNTMGFADITKAKAHIELVPTLNTKGQVPTEEQKQRFIKLCKDTEMLGKKIDDDNCYKAYLEGTDAMVLRNAIIDLAMKSDRICNDLNRCWHTLLVPEKDMMETMDKPISAVKDNGLDR